MMKQISEDKENFYSFVFSELKSLGVKVPKVKKFKSSIPKQDKISPSYNSQTFGVCLCDQEKVYFTGFLLPKFIVATTCYLRRFTKKEIGLFRKAGSISRQRDLRAKLEKGENIDESEPNDVASLLKQWLRELPEPLIPSYLHDLFVRCSYVETEENKVAAILLCCHLLPSDHLHTLKHLLEFLCDIANNSDQNKMNAHNLALIMAPNIFATESDPNDRSSCFTVIQQYACVTEILIIHAKKVGEVSACSSAHLLEANVIRDGNDLDSSVDILDYSPSKSKKKRRSGPVHDLFNGIKKLVGQNSTSPNPSKRLVPDDGQSILSSVSRSTSKRKADPEVQSMSPAKKQAIASNIVSNADVLTPNSKSSQNVFIMLKERTGSAHSRRKSFGLLRRKDKKRQKATNSSSAKEPETSISTPVTLKDKLSGSFQDCLELNIEPQKTSPLLSQSDIDKIFSNISVVKKSVSDCYLTIPNEEFKDSAIPTFTSERCLRNNKTRYNLRSENTTKQIVKRKSDIPLSDKIFNYEAKSSILGKENIEESRLISHRKCFKSNPLKEIENPKEGCLSPKDTSIILDTKNFNKLNNVFLPRNSPQDFPTLLVPLEVTVKRSSSRKKRNIGNTSGLNLSPIKGEKLCNTNAADENEESVVNYLPAECSIKKLPVLEQNADKMQRKHSINRQEAFRVKSQNSRKISLTQIKSADSTVSSNCRSKSITKYHTKADETNIHASEKVILKDKKNSEICHTSNKKRVKRNIRNGSIVRGKPNTIKSGLPSDLGGRFNNESISIKARNRALVSTTSVDNDLFINIIDHVDKNNKDVAINVKNNPQNNDHDMSILLQIQKMSLYTPENESIKLIDVNKNICNNNLQTEISVSKDNLTVPEKKRKERLCSNSDSKVHKTKRKSSKVSRTNSFPEPIRKSSRIAKRLRALDSSSPQNNETGPGKENRVKCDSNLENTNNIINASLVNAKPPDTWISGRKFLETEPVFQEDGFNKRESIAMILKNNPGHVQAKVHLYDLRNRSSSTSTPINYQFSTPIGNFQSAKMSQKRNASSLKINRSGGRRICDSSVKCRNLILPPPPKFAISDINSLSPKLNHPLKELTNISNREESLSISPIKNSLGSSVKTMSPQNIPIDKKNQNDTRKSYSGHTPYKLPKVPRSESSPMLSGITGNSVLKSHKSLSRSPSVIRVPDYNLSFSNVDYFSSPMLKTRHMLSTEN